MTALSETEHIVAGLSAGGVDYVTKPIVVDELLARIRVHLANARVTYGARAALDVTGRCLLAVDGAGTVLWSTPQTESLLGAGGGPGRGDAFGARVKTRPGARDRRSETANQRDADGFRRITVSVIRSVVAVGGADFSHPVAVLPEGGLGGDAGAEAERVHRVVA